MIIPNKFISFNESVLSKLKYILEAGESVALSELYQITEDHFDSIDQFLYALDVLYVLDKVEFDSLKRLIIKC